MITGIFDQDKWQEILATMNKNRLRTFLTALGVFWGIFMLVFLLGMGKGLENGVYKDFGGGARNIAYIWGSRTSLPYKGFKEGRRIRLDLSLIDILKKKVPSLNIAVPRSGIGIQKVTRGIYSGEYEVRGELIGMDYIQAYNITRGRYLNQSDINDARKVVVIGTTVNDVLFGEEDPIGQDILIRGVNFTVIGVFQPENLNNDRRDDLSAVVIPITAMSRSFGTGEYFGYMVCEAKPGYMVSEMEAEIRRIIFQMKNIHPNDTRGLGGYNVQEEFLEIQSLFAAIKMFLWFVGVGTLLAGIIGVSNIMLIIVKERTKEIGIRKALGATPGSIISMILTESVFITALSGILGLALGTLIIGGVSYLMIANNIETENFYNPQVNGTVGMIAIGVLVFAGLLAGLMPARQAAKVNPVIALKDE